MNISIVIFCYNERDSIGKVLPPAIEVAKNLGDDWEIIVVNDGSTDGTDEVLASWPEVKTITHPVNLGIGAALRSGYAAASKEFVCAIPGDGQFDVRELLALKPFPVSQIWSFYRPQKKYGPYRSALTLGNKVFNKMCLGMYMKDINWIKVYRKDQLDFVDMTLHSSVVESEICAKLIKAGCVPMERPSIYHDRQGGISTGGSWRTLSKAIREIFALYLAIYRFNKRLPSL